MNRRIAGWALFFTLLIVTRLSIVHVEAETTYWIATEGLQWVDLRIQINMPSSSPVLANDLPQAMTIWNQAIKWFESTFYTLNERYYSLIPSGADTGVTIQAVDMQTLHSLCSRSTSATVACTHFRYNSNGGYISTAYVEILASQLTAANPTHLLTVVTALGMLLGLIQYSTPCPFVEDLMCESSPTTYPSTLDLYALHLLAEGNVVKNVTLPANIPYQQSSIPTPEFPGATALLTFIAMSSTLILLRSCRRRRHH